MSEAATKVDGRTQRAMTGRGTQFTTRITPELQHEIKVFAVQHRMTFNALLEQGFELHKKKKAKGK